MHGVIRHVQVTPREPEHPVARSRQARAHTGETRASPLKVGTKVRNIRLVEGDHDIDCKIDGFGAMALKSEFVKKA